MVNLKEVPASAVTRVGVQAPVWAASSPVTVGGLLACAGVPCAMPPVCGLEDTGPSARKGRSLPRVSPTPYIHQQILGRPSTRKPYESTTRITVFGGGVKGSHPLREPEPV
jgi:hypothetical protein